MTYKIAVFWLVIATCAALAPGCNESRTTTAGSLNNSSSSLAGQYGSHNSGLDLGEDWAAPARVGTSRAGGRNASRSADAATGRWAIALQTFSGPNHAENAHTMLRNIPQITPEIARETWVHTIAAGTGSVVVYGRYPSQSDARARADLNRIKGLAAMGQSVYPRAMLIPLDPPSTSASGAAPQPHELMSVRTRFPNVHPLYTLQVALWSDYDTGQLTLEQIRSSAEAHTRKLRAEGVEAYVHHDDAQRTSVVTVGLFGRNALDVETGLYSPEVDAMMKRFPVHLVNGEQLIDRRTQSGQPAPGPPHLVVVPRQ